MKKIILFLFISISLFAVDLIKLQFLEIKVKHNYSNGKIEDLIIQREINPVCMNIPVNVQMIQSENLASKNVASKM